jgi:hypothetical protein
MEIPFYISFKEFEKNYPADLASWFEYCCDSNELDFLKELVEQYYYFLEYDFTEDKLIPDVTITLADCIFPYHEKSECRFVAAYQDGKKKKVFRDENENVFEWKKITMMQYAQHNGDMKAAKLYLECIGALKMSSSENNHSNVNNNTLIQNQNNMIQINGMVLSQEIVKKLGSEQLSTIEGILKTIEVKDSK